MSLSHCIDAHIMHYIRYNIFPLQPRPIESTYSEVQEELISSDSYSYAVISGKVRQRVYYARYVIIMVVTSHVILCNALQFHGPAANLKAAERGPHDPNRVCA